MHACCHRAGGVDPTADGPEALARLSSHLSENYVAVDVAAFRGALRLLNVEPPVISVERLLTPEQCDALVAAADASGRMATSGVGGHNVGGKVGKCEPAHPGGSWLRDGRSTGADVAAGARRYFWCAAACR
eukprot:167997-Chlamydomonas_euryale.AAC.5